MKKIYLVLPCYNEELVIEDSAFKLNLLMKSLISEKRISACSKVVFVNDGSQDETWEIISKICSINKLFCGINLAHNKGHQNALLAGMLSVKDKCDAVITLDADLQHDINVIPEFIKKYEEGYEIVYGVRKSRKGEGIFKKITGNGFYDFLLFLGVDIVKNHADYRLMSSKAINALSKYNEVNLFLRGIIPQIGFKSTTLEYDELSRLAGESKYSMKKMLKLASDGITSFSVKPLQFISISGVFFFLFSIVLVLYSLFTRCTNGRPPEWTSIVGPIWMLGGIQLLALGIVGEYIGKIYMESKHRPRYEIDEAILNEQALFIDKPESRECREETYERNIT